MFICGAGRQSMEPITTAADVAAFRKKRCSQSLAGAKSQCAAGRGMIKRHPGNYKDEST